MNRPTIEPARLLGLATAMGLAARLDDTGGYGEGGGARLWAETHDRGIVDGEEVR